jgi:hypothetical protein
MELKNNTKIEVFTETGWLLSGSEKVELEPKSQILYPNSTPKAI